MRRGTESARDGRENGRVGDGRRERGRNEKSTALGRGGSTASIPVEKKRIQRERSEDDRRRARGRTSPGPTLRPTHIGTLRMRFISRLVAAAFVSAALLSRASLADSDAVAASGGIETLESGAGDSAVLRSKAAAEKLAREYQRAENAPRGSPARDARGTLAEQLADYARREIEDDAAAQDPGAEIWAGGSAATRDARGAREARMNAAFEILASAVAAACSRDFACSARFADRRAFPAPRDSGGSWRPARTPSSQMMLGDCRRALSGHGLGREFASAVVRLSIREIGRGDEDERRRRRDPPGAGDEGAASRGGTGCGRLAWTAAGAPDTAPRAPDQRDASWGELMACREACRACCWRPAPGPRAYNCSECEPTDPDARSAGATRDPLACPGRSDRPDRYWSPWDNASCADALQECSDIGAFDNASWLAGHHHHGHYHHDHAHGWPPLRDPLAEIADAIAARLDAPGLDPRECASSRFFDAYARDAEAAAAALAIVLAAFAAASVFKRSRPAPTEGRPEQQRTLARAPLAALAPPPAGGADRGRWTQAPSGAPACSARGPRERAVGFERPRAMGQTLYERTRQSPSAASGAEAAGDSDAILAIGAPTSD